MKKAVFFLLLVMIFPILVIGQSEIGRFISSGAQDMENLTEAYLNPFGKGFGAAMNSGWYWTAETHQSFGFDFTVNTTLVTVPTADQTFSFGDYDWQLLSPGNSLTSATIMGSNSGASVGLAVEEGGNTYNLDDLYTLPDGVGIDFVPLPMMQLGVGIYKGTDVTFRYFPEMELGDYGKIGMIGFGLKHDIKQWIPGLKQLPFHLSIQGAWSRLSGSYSQIDYFPTNSFEVRDTDLPVPNTTQGDIDIQKDYYNTQDLVLTTKAWNMNLIVSKKLSVFTAFASLGYSSSTFNISLNGNYLIPQYIPITSPDYNSIDDTNNDGFVTVLDGENAIVDPINVDIIHKSVNAAIGFQLKLAIVSLHAAYVYQDYGMVNFGLGFSFR
jgi:hypothetical protein